MLTSKTSYEEIACHQRPRILSTLYVLVFLATDALQTKTYNLR